VRSRRLFSTVLGLFVAGFACLSQAQIGPLPGMGPLIFAGTPPVAVTSQASTSQNSGATTYTFTSMAIGTAAANRYVVAAITGTGISGAETVSTVTIGGISAVQLVSDSLNGGSNNVIALFIALVPTGTTANVVATFSVAQVRAGAATWSVTNLLSTTPTGTNSAQSTISAAVTASANVTGQGAIIGACMEQPLGATFTWTNLSSDFNVNGGTNTIVFGGAHALFSSTVNQSVTCTASSLGSVGVDMVIAGLR
jgi:hypothetical protein